MQINDVAIQDILPEILGDLPELVGIAGEYVRIPGGLPVIRKRRADLIYRVTGERPRIQHIEFQAQRDRRIADRMLEYYVDLRYRLRTKEPELSGLPIHQLVVYGGPADWKPELEIREHNLIYRFELLDTKTIDPAPLLAHGSVGTAPFAVLCRGGTKLNVLETVLNRIKAAPASERGDNLLKLLVLSRLQGIEPLVRTEMEAMGMWPLNLEEITFIKEREKRGEQRALEAAKRASIETIVRIMRLRFEHVPADLNKRLAERTQQELNEIVVRAATAVSAEAALDL